MYILFTRIGLLGAFLALLMPAWAQSGPRGSTQPSPSPLKPQHSDARNNEAVIIRDAEILIFDGPIEAVYTLTQDLTEGRIQVFNDLKIEAEYELPDLAAGKHFMDIPDGGFYWSEKEDELPDPTVFFAVGTSGINDSVTALWSDSEASAYDYKPEKCEKHPEDLCDDAAMFRGNDVAISNFFIPGKRNLQLRAAGDSPQVEIQGVGFVEGTEVEYGRGTNPKRIYKTLLRDVRVVSTVSHDDDPDIPVLKAGRFTVPKEVFEYPAHIRIVGKVKR